MTIASMCLGSVIIEQGANSFACYKQLAQPYYGFQAELSGGVI